ncbi:hypothetical protein WEI85_09935 [Actinomycetes bacterium KLBMP 9797]
MGTYLRLDDDPENIANTGASLLGMATDFKAQAQTILGEIQAIDAERPWASDKYGQAFEKNYTQPGEGQEEPLRDAAQERLTHAGEPLEKVGNQTIQAMAGFKATDDQGGAEIRATYT